MVDTATGLSVEEFLALPETDGRYELVDGRLETLMAPRARHGYIAGQLLHFIVSALGENGDYYIGVEVEFRTRPRTVRRPDMLYISADRARDCIDPETDIVVRAPDLVVEVLSPGEERRDAVDKLREYALVGVPHYWIIDPPRHRVSLYHLDGNEYVLEAEFSEDQTLSSSLFPGIGIPLVSLWRFN